MIAYSPEKRSVCQVYNYTNLIKLNQVVKLKKFKKVANREYR
jgi:hypothetical protein